MRIPIWISNRHIHLSQEDVEKLFGKWHELTVLKMLSQPWEFAAQEVVSIQWPKGKIDKVRVLWPVRKTTQVEIMLGDCFVLWVEAAIKLSGDHEGTPGIKIIWPAGEVDLSKGVIVAKRHLHCTVKEAEDMWIKSWDMIKVKTIWERGLIFDNVEVRAKDSFALDMHIDIEEANAAGLWVGAWGEIVK